MAENTYTASELRFCRGRTKESRNVVYRGYQYGSVMQLKNGDQSWCCIVKKCKGRIHTSDTHVNIVREHDHEPDISQCDAKQAMSRAKELAVSTRTKPTVIVADTTATLSIAARAKLPNPENRKKQLHYVRKQADARPAEPNGIEDIRITQQDCITKDGQPMLLHDNNNPFNRLIMFGTQTCLKILEKCKSWYIDGTFEKCPKHFYQLVTIHAEIEKDQQDTDGEIDNHTTWVIPCIWVLLSGKKQDHYEELFSELVHLGHFDPTYIMCDYELGLRTAITIYFPYVTLSGCYFHFSNAVRKNWCEKHKIEYMRVIHDNDVTRYTDTKILARRLVGLAFVPLANIQESFDTIVTNLPEDLFQKHVDEVQYFQKTWVGGNVAGRTTAARYPPPNWNVRQRTLDKNNRTNNHCESFHSKLKYFIEGAGKPNIWGFLAGMKSFQSDIDNDIVSMRLGHNPPRRSKKEIGKDLRIYNATQQFNNMNLLDYLDFVMEL